MHLLAVLSLAAAAPEPLRLVLPDMTGVGVDGEKTRFFTEHLSGRLSEVGAQVTTQRALQQLLGIERQKQLMGCAGESGACIAELASALGSDALVLGDVALIDGRYQVNLKIISGSDGKVLGTHQARVGSQAELLDELDKASFALVSAAATALHRAAPTPLAIRAPLRTIGIVSLGVGLAGAVTGAVLLSQAGVQYGRIPQKAGQTGLPTTQVEAIAAQGKAFQTAGWVCVGVGVAALGAGVGLWVVGRPPPVRASVVVGNGAAVLMLGGDF
jgi:hypothetical protein